MICRSTAIVGVEQRAAGSGQRAATMPTDRMTRMRASSLSLIGSDQALDRTRLDEGEAAFQVEEWLFDDRI
jgi:hypothetical protein